MTNYGRQRTADLRPFPRGPLLGAGALVAVALASTALVRMTAGAIPEHEATVVAARDLRFEDRSDGSVAVLDVSDGATIETVMPGTNGFLRATLRGLARDRRLRGIGAETPFHLAERSNGQLILVDPAIGRQIYLDAFGATNSSAFSRFLHGGNASR